MRKRDLCVDRTTSQHVKSLCEEAGFKAKPRTTKRGIS